MPLTTLTAESPRTSRSIFTPAVCPLTRAARLTPRGPLARYIDHAGSPREVLALPGRGGSVLVVDRDGATWGDRRLVAHLAADEPLENAHLVCRHYLRDPRPRRCRPLAREDLVSAPFFEGCELPEGGRGRSAPAADAGGAARPPWFRHRLEALATSLSIPELRWCHFRLEHRGDRQPESVRDAVARIEGYEPVRALTVRALAHHRDDAAVSVAVLRSELQRLDASRIVLNRGCAGRCCTRCAPRGSASARSPTAAGG